MLIFKCHHCEAKYQVHTVFRQMIIFNFQYLGKPTYSLQLSGHNGSMKKAKNLTVAVFPFKNLVLYPNAAVPLYIFEPNYVRMIRECAENGIPIALGLGDPVQDHKGKDVPNVLTPKKIMGIGTPHIIEEYEDNSIYVIIEGCGKVELNHVLQNLPYLICDAQLIHDVQEEPQPLLGAPIEKLSGMLQEWLEHNVVDEEQKQVFQDKIISTHHVLDYIAMFLIKDPALKQILLETDRLTERIRLLDVLLRSGAGSENKYYGSIVKIYEGLDQRNIMVQ
jgi:Lon protease-like protein